METTIMKMETIIANTVEELDSIDSNKNTTITRDKLADIILKLSEARDLLMRK